MFSIPFSTRAPAFEAISPATILLLIYASPSGFRSRPYDQSRAQLKTMTRLLSISDLFIIYINIHTCTILDRFQMFLKLAKITSQTFVSLSLPLLYIVGLFLGLNIVRINC